MISMVLDRWGMNKTTERVNCYAIWYNMLDSCWRCTACNRQNTLQTKSKAHQVRYHAGSPLKRIHKYILWSLIETPRANQYVLVVVDQFSKWVECYILSQTILLSGLLKPCCQSSLEYLDALLSCTVIKFVTLRVGCSIKCVTY